MKQLRASHYSGPSEITAEALVSKKPISFLEMTNYDTGEIIYEDSDLCGMNYAGKILVYPFGKGSSGDCMRIWRSVAKGVGPAAIINYTPDPIHVEGALLAEIGFLFGFDQNPCEFFKTGEILYIKDGLITVKE